MDKNFDWVNFIENEPPYVKIEIDKSQLYGMSTTKEICIDSYCFNCGQESIFKYSKCDSSDMRDLNGTITETVGILHGAIQGLENRNFIPKINSKLKYKIYKELDFYCAKCNERHEYFFATDRQVIYKVGQDPSYADLKGLEINKYKNLISKYFIEFKASLNCYSQGKGIASFVYLRRILEDIIEKEYKKIITNPKTTIRFLEKMKIVQEHENIIPNEFDDIKDQLYSILSNGVHEYDEKECLELYESVKFIITGILDKQLLEKQRQEKIKEVKSKIKKNIKE